jgi:hypothetical protein
LLAGAAVLTGATLLAACSSAPQAPIPVTSVGAKPAEPTTWAMTGLPDAQDGNRQPVYAVKLDNTTASLPQQGLDKADLVVQEPVEGGATRLAAFYESTSPKVVGPVRSIRTSDFGLVKPANATLVASGGAPIVLAAAQQAGIEVLDEGSEGFFRDLNRTAPYNLFVDMKRIRESAGGNPANKPYLTFGDFDAPAGVVTKQIDVNFSILWSEKWSYDKSAGDWLRGGAGGDFAAKNLLMLKVKVGDAGYLDPAGNGVPEVATSGTGNGWLAVGQQIRRIRWSKRSDAAKWVLTTETGLVIELPPGKSWISLLPVKTGSVDSK